MISPRTTLLLATLSFAAACAHEEPTPPAARSGRVGTSPLAPFDVDTPSPSSRETLAAALRQRGFLPADAPPGTQLGASIRAFQRSEGLRETGFPDDETLRRLGMDPATTDRSLDTSEVNQMGATGAAAAH